MTFIKQVLAYLTGWLIVQPTYNRLLKAWRKRELRNPSAETIGYFNLEADRIIERMIERDLLPQREARFPREEAGFTIIGPQCFAGEYDGHMVINWMGENFVPQGPPDGSLEPPA